MFTRRHALISAIAILVPVRVAAAQSVIYRNPGCGCCHEWSLLMDKAGFPMRLEDTDDLAGKLSAIGLPAELHGCHGGLIGGYAVSGHIPPADVRRLLDEKPDAIGLTVPGMPMGSPGMGGEPEAFDTLLVKRGGKTEIFASHA